MPDFEEPLVEAAKRYLKERYGEDTVSMTVFRIPSGQAHGPSDSARKRTLPAGCSQL